jgi:hypothetical protein|tara:strand:+ start:772 stop:1041 length:270 start_codon:yes stop_codon:yes gene_type:complete
MKQIKRTVDDRLPKWLHSNILSAIDYIWQSKGNPDESVRRVKEVDDSGQLTAEQLEWVMMLLILPKLKDMVATSDAFKDFKARKKASVH